MSKNINKLGLCLLFLSTPSVFAAQAIDLRHQDASLLRSFTTPPGFKGMGDGNSQGVGIKEVSQSIDFNQTMHIRMQQTYFGYPVFGAESVVHIPKGHEAVNKYKNTFLAAEKSKATMNGKMFQDLQKDLQDTSNQIFKPEQAEKAIAEATAIYNGKISGKFELQDKKAQLKIYVDKNNKAHWVFDVNLYGRLNSFPTNPVFIMDAESLKVYQSWNEVKSMDAQDKVKGGGFGGNRKMGKVSYDGLNGHLPALDLTRNAYRSICYLVNNDVSVIDFMKNQPEQFPCYQPDKQHNNIFWNSDLDKVNGGYSPGNDALFAGKVIKDMYQNWYKIPVLVDQGAPLHLTMVIHSPNYDEYGRPDPDNAFWDDREQKMYFGDGQDIFYPLTSIGVAAHEISHGFTQQHSDLIYDQQSGGLNESFSDMAAQAAEFFYSGKSSWQIGSEITKEKDLALRYMDEPTKDCVYRARRLPYCSLNSVQAYETYLREHINDRGTDRDGYEYDNRQPDVHHSSGIFNKAFYLIATSPGWDVHKAFDIMVKANMHYWTPNTDFFNAACGVMSATKDYRYDLAGVTKAFSAVGIDVGGC